MLELYHNVNSVCAQKVRVALAEKGLEYREHLMTLRGDQFDAAYMKLNPNAVVPTLIHDGRPVMGVVHIPAQQRTYWGTPAGAFVEVGDTTTRLAVSDVTSAAGARLVASKSHRSTEIDRVKTELGIKDELNIASVGAKLGLIACGVRDLYVNPATKTKAWDTCAPEAILVRAGGKLTDLLGRPIDYTRELKHQAGLVASQRGPEGGYRLDGSPSDITVADVIRAVDGPLASVRGGRPEEASYEGPAAELQTEARRWCGGRRDAARDERTRRVAARTKEHGRNGGCVGRGVATPGFPIGQFVDDSGSSLATWWK